ncbi:MAG: proton-conducting transporter membrane subunit [Actinomycetota bacterium]|nr:proton-conducting transporter membrane subunit [Actinomycetota bacterium]
MIFFLVVIAHFVAGGLALIGLRRRPVIAAVVGSLVLAGTALLVVARGIGTTAPLQATVEWLPLLGFNFVFQLDGFAVVMALLVSVLGLGVLVYSIAYFEHDATFGRFVGLFMAFAGSMTGLVLAADLFTMFIFWELTSVWSFLLIGLNDKSASARQAAVRALLTTGAGGLCMLGGIGLLQVQYGTTSFSELMEIAPRGTVANVAAVLLLLGAFTKSAQVPFHFWLPGAMAAPTPVSAYLHSATMVKAGIVLLARMSPIFADAGIWRWWVVAAGVATMLLGGWRALRESDAKLVLAHSTVSQLGLLTVLFGIGSPSATYAGVAHLVAHAIFKAGLFLGIGVIDHEIGTRDVAHISTARRVVPISVLAIGALLFSMAGIIPLFGFATKEKALVALLDADVGAAGTVALWGVVVGSVLSVAYSVRLLHALVRSHSPETPSAPAGDASQVVRVGLTLPVIIAGVVSLGFGFAAASVGKWLVAPSSSLDVQAVSKLALWPGINDALLISLAVIFVGAVVGWRAPLARAGQRKPLGERVFDSLYDATLGVSKRITALTQSGSLPVYVGVTLLMVAGAPITALLMGDTQPLQNVTGGSLLEAVVTLLAVALAVGVAVVPSRFTGALFLGGVGYAIAVIFALRGAPDLAVTQLLVETLTVVVFLLALRAMVRRESIPSRAVPHTLRITVALAVGIAVPLFVLAARTARTQPSAAQEYFARSVAEAGGRNVVNVILVDFRGFDTMGEIVVLAIAALGVANLVRAAEQHRRTAKSAKVSQ